MLISESLEHTPPVTAAENMANRLADRIRNIWLDKTQSGIQRWEVNFFEDPEGVSFLCGESFPNLLGIDYIFKWWGGGHELDEMAGELEVLWKASRECHVELYKTWIRFGGQDFLLGSFREESRKREVFREEFRRAFTLWQALYQDAM